jgi:UDP-glucose 4-epimerase
MMHYLVTGGAGFIGSHLCERLLRDGHAVRVLDDFSTGREENIAAIHDRVSLMRASVADRAAVKVALDGIDGVFHLAAIPSVPRSIADPIRTHVSIADGTLALLEEMRLRGGGRLVLASSSSIYGETEVLPKREDLLPDPLSPYAVAKLLAEHYAVVYARLYGIKTVSLRYFNVFGPRQDPRSEYAAVIPRFVTAALAGESPVIYGDGRQSRDFTYVENVVEANLLAMKADLAGAVMNVAVGERIDLLAVVGMIGEILGREIAPRFEPPRPGDIKHSYAAVDRARSLLGFSPSVDFRAGLLRTIDYFRPLSGGVNR